MRNLKRALSLALAVVMVVGLMIVGAGAASVEDFGDYAEIKNKEAVGLLTDLGVINGGSDGNFSPNGTLTRAQFAKIAYLLSQTQTDYSRYAGTGVAKDAAGHWAEGALVWCNTWRNQIITGGSDGNFWPDGTLKVVECAVMMLRVLGYNNYLEGFTGNGWEIRTLNKADEVGLMKGLEDLKAGDLISRDDACLMAFNALLAKRVYHTESWNPTAQTMVPTGYDEDHYDATKGEDKLLSAIFKADSATVTVAGFNDKGEPVDGSDKKIEGLNITPDMVGTTVSYYKIGDKVLASSATSTATTAATFDGAQWDAKTKAARPGAKPEFTVADAAGFYLNGAKVADKDAAKIGAGSIVAMVSTDADAEIELVQVTNKTVATVGDDGVKTETKGKNTTVTVDGVIDTATNVNNVVGYEGLKAGDVVLYVTIAGKTTIEKAQRVTGKVSAVSSDDVYTVGSNKLDASGLVTDAKLNTTNFKDEFHFYQDNYGHVVAVTDTAGKPATPEVKHAVVTDFGYVKTGAGTGIGADKGSTTYQAELLFPDGNSAVVEMTTFTVKGTIYNDTGKGADKDATYAALLADTALASAVTATKGSLVSYVTDKDGKYALTSVGTNVAAGSLVSGKPVFTDGLIGNKNTTFILKVGTGANAKIQVVTGIDNLPTSTDAEGKGGGIKKGSQITAESGFVTLAYLEIDAVDGVVSDAELAFFVDNTKFTKTAAGYVVKAIVDGKETELVVAAKEDGSAMLDSAASLKNALVSVKYDADGKVVEVDPDITGMTKLEGITAMGEFVKKDDTMYRLDPDAVIYKVEGDKVSTVTPDKIGEALAKKDKTTYNAYVALGTGAESETIFTMYITVVVEP